jgi:hypothetical protein
MENPRSIIFADDATLLVTRMTAKKTITKSRYLKCMGLFADSNALDEIRDSIYTPCFVKDPRRNNITF